MNQSTHRAIQHLFQVSSLEAVTLEQLEKLVDDYPCFGFGHYLLSHKLRVGNSDQFLPATQKTSLYFANPFWLQWMLENTSRPQMVTPEVGSDPLQTGPDSSGSAAEMLFESIEQAKSLRESLQKIDDDLRSHNGQETAQPMPMPAETPVQVAEEPVEVAQGQVEVAQAPIQDEEPPFVLDETDQTLPISAEPPATIPVTETTSVAETAAPSIHTPPVTDSTPLFEPLHTIDYFASQGIRLTLDENPTDALGRQLKSFTEWLRTMRRLPQKDREIIPDRVAEQAVQDYAAHSIEGKEPVTETMAEVLAKQGMPDRARVVYEKLSLLNPDKSAYFAAKIEQLNSH